MPLVIKSIICLVSEGTVRSQVLCDVCRLVACLSLGYLYYSLGARIVWRGVQYHVGRGRSHRRRERSESICY
jgi:hypothetical protein